MTASARCWETWPITARPLARGKLEAALAVPLQSLAALGADASGLNAGASIGIALCPTEGHDMQTLLKRADQDMYERKQARNASWPDQAR